MLAAMSFERFIAVVRPLQWLGIRISRQKRVNNAFVLLICLLLTVALLCSPMIYYAQVQHYMFFYPDGSMALGDSICGSQLPDKLMVSCVNQKHIILESVPVPVHCVHAAVRLHCAIAPDCCLLHVYHSPPSAQTAW